MLSRLLKVFHSELRNWTYKLQLESYQQPYTGVTMTSNNVGTIDNYRSARLFTDVTR
jgi:hypothetical protein